VTSCSSNARGEAGLAELRVESSLGRQRHVVADHLQEVESSLGRQRHVVADHLQEFEWPCWKAVNRDPR